MARYEFSEGDRVVLERLNIPMTIYQFIDKRVVTLLVTNGMVNLMGMPREEIIELFDTDMYRDTHPDDKGRVADAALKFAAGGEKFDVVYRTMSHLLNDYVIIHSHGAHFFTEDGTMISSTIYMVEGFGNDSSNPLTEKLASNFNNLMTKESLIRDNFYDTLTGLPNMSYFIQLANAAKRTMFSQDKVPVILYFNIVGMKFYNEKYGLQGGDVLLVEFTRILKKYFPNENIGRMGQDHFAVYSDEDEIEDILENIFAEVKNNREVQTLPVHVGIYPASFEDVPAATAIDRAKIVCDMQKGIYNSIYAYYNEKVHEDAKQYDYVLNTFEIAMAEGWIKPFYQPIIRSVNGKVCDEEALARWIDPNKGTIPPDKFISVLEDAKLIHKFDLYMVDRVLEDMRFTREKGYPLIPVSINLSKYDFKLCNIVEEISNKVKAVDIEPELITLEVTESVSTFEENFVKAQIQKAHDAGFKVWMDDFGSGYSSLNMLQKFDFDTIKFDLKFMREFNVNPRSHIILQQLMLMADKLDIDTVVEGVETIEQAKFLREIGADKMQGFYWDKPNDIKTKHSILDNEIGNYVEIAIETSYFDAVSKANLIEPDLDEDYKINADEYFGPLPIGVFEVEGEEVRVLRYNKTYANFLLKTDYIKPSDLGNGIMTIRKKASDNFYDCVNRAIETGRWERLDNNNVNGVKADAFMKMLSKNPNSGAIAIQIVIASLTGN